MARKARLARLNRVKQILPKVNLAALQHPENVGPPNRLHQFDLNARIALCVAMQELGHDTFNELRGRCYLQQARLAASEQLRPFPNRTGVAQQATAIAKQLLAFPGQNQPAAYPVKEPETKLLLENIDLSGQGRLGDTQAQRRPGDGAQLGHGDECSYVPQVHDTPHAETAWIARNFMNWTRADVTTITGGLNHAAACHRRLGGEGGVMRSMRLLLVLVLGLALSAYHAEAQSWPTKPVRAVVPFGAGSVSDIVPRVVFEQLSTQLGQRIVVENRVGAGGTIGASFVASAEPDGYTLLANSSAHAIVPSLYANLSYDPARDFAAVAPLGVTPFVLVVPPTAGYKTARDLVVTTKAKPGTLNFASVGIGSASHLSAERFRLSAGIEAVHVPFKGGPEAITEVMAGRIDFYFVAMGAALPQIQSGKLTALLVNGDKRAAQLPDVPTIREAGFSDAEYPTWFGVFLPAKTPRDIVDTLQRETLKALQERKVREKLADLGVEPMVMNRGDFEAYVRREIALNAALVDALKLKVQ